MPRYAAVIEDVPYRCAGCGHSMLALPYENDDGHRTVWCTNGECIHHGRRLEVPLRAVAATVCPLDVN